MPSIPVYTATDWKSSALFSCEILINISFPMTQVSFLLINTLIIHYYCMETIYLEHSGIEVSNFNFNLGII